MRSALAFQITQAEYIARTTGSLRLAYVNERMPIKKLADDAGSSVATAKNWWEQRNAPEGLYHLRLLATVPEYQAEVRRLTNMQADMDPEFERDLARLLQTYQQKRGAQ